MAQHDAILASCRDELHEAWSAASALLSAGFKLVFHVPALLFVLAAELLLIMCAWLASPKLIGLNKHFMIRKETN